MPKLLKTPFAIDAAEGFRTDIQESAGAAPNSATYRVGFPPVTMQSIASNGMPPKGSDLNGVLYDITDNLVFLTQGGGYGFDSAYATSIGGYPLNARLRLTNGDIVKSDTDGNTNDPNSDMTGWVKTNDASQVFDENGKTQQEINDNQADKNSLTVDLLDFIPKPEWANIFNKTSNFDCSDALEQAINTGMRVIVSKSGLYIFKTSKSFTRDIVIDASTQDVWFDFSQVPIAQNGLSTSGSLTDIAIGFASQINIGGRSVTLPSVSGLNIGDYLAFWNPTDFSYSPFRDYYRDGVFQQIIDISGNDVTFSKPFKKTFAAGSLNIYKMNLVKLALNNIKIKYFTTYTGANGGAGAVRADIAQVETNNFHAEGSANAMLTLSRCPLPVLNNTTGYNLGHPTGGGGLDYFILFGNCQDWRMNGGDVYARRHAIAQGGGALPASVPCIGGRAVGFTGIKNHPNTAVGAFDMHGNVEDCQVIDSTVYGAAKFGGGGDNFYVNCRIYGDDLNGRIAFGAELLGGRHGFIGGELFSYKSPIAGSQAFIDWGSNNSVITSDMTRDFTFVTKGIKVNLYAAASNDYFIRIPNRGSSAKINVNVDGIEFNSNVKVSSCVRIDTISGVAASDFIIVDNISGANTPIPIVHANDDYKQFPHRLPVVQGQYTINTTASASIATPTLSYGITFPRRPNISLELSGVDGAALDNLAGQSTYQAIVAAQGFTGFSARLKAPANFIAGSSVNLYWSARLVEC